MLGASPLSKTPYRTSTQKLLELKMQFQELLEKNYIPLSGSPWETPVLFVKNTYGIHW